MQTTFQPGDTWSIDHSNMIVGRVGDTAILDAAVTGETYSVTIDGGGLVTAPFHFAGITAEGTELKVEKVFVGALSADGSTLLLHFPEGVAPSNWSGDTGAFGLTNWLACKPDGSATAYLDSAVMDPITRIFSADVSSSGFAGNDELDFATVADNGCTSSLTIGSPISSQNGDIGQLGRDPASTLIDTGLGIQIPLLNLALSPTLSVGTVTKTSVQLNWAALRGVDVAYQVYWDIDGYAAPVYDGPATTVTLTGLLAGQTYRFSIRAYNLAGTGAFSAPLEVQARSDASTQAGNLAVHPWLRHLPVAGVTL